MTPALEKLFHSGLAATHHINDRLVVCNWSLQGIAQVDLSWYVLMGCI